MHRKQWLGIVVVVVLCVALVSFIYRWQRGTVLDRLWKGVSVGDSVREVSQEFYEAGVVRKQINIEGRWVDGFVFADPWLGLPTRVIVMDSEGRVADKYEL